MSGCDDCVDPSGRKQLYREGGIQAIEPFREGQLLSAAACNELVDALKELDLRLKALEQH